MLAASISGSVCCCLCFCTPRTRFRTRENMRLRRSIRMAERSSRPPGLVQGSTQSPEGSNLKLQQENRERGENSKVLAGVGSPTSTAMRGELQGGSFDSGASPFHVDNEEIPPNPPPQAPVQGSDRAASGISKAANSAGVAVPAIDSVKSQQTESRGDCVDDLNLSTRLEGKSSAQDRFNDSHAPHGFSTNPVPVGPAPAPTDLHRSHEDERGSRSQSLMPRAEGGSGFSESISWIGPPCSRCKSTSFSMYTNANAESDVNQMQYKCNNCKRRLCTSEYLRSYKMSNPDPSKLAASNSNMKAMPPPSKPNLKLMPPPAYTRKPNVCLPDSQDTALRSAKTTLSPRSSSCSDKLGDDHPSRESNLQLGVAPEPAERFPMEILEAMGPFPLGENREEPPSNQSADGNQKEPLFANRVFSVKGLRDSIRSRGSSPLEENKKASGGVTVSVGEGPSNSLPCPRCKSTNTRFCWLGRYYCDNCREYWTLSLLQQLEVVEVQLPAEQCPKGKEKQIETLDEAADQFPGKGLGESSRGPPSLPLQDNEDGDGGSESSDKRPLNALSCSHCDSTFTRLCTYGLFCDDCGKFSPFERPLNALSCLRCNSTFTRLCTYGVFCDACGKHSPFEGTRDRQLQVPAINPPVTMPHEGFDVDGRSRGHEVQLLPPPRRPIMVDASTQMDNGSCGQPLQEAYCAWASRVLAPHKH